MGRKRSNDLSWMLSFLGENRLQFGLTIGLSVIAFLFASALMFTSGFMISLAAFVPASVLALHIPSIFVRIFGIGKPVIQYFERLLSHDWVLRMTSRLRVLLFDAISSVPFVDISDAGYGGFVTGDASKGKLISLLQDDIEHLQNLFLRSIFPLLSIWILYLIVVIVSGFFSIPFALFMLASLSVVLFVLPAFAILLNKARIYRSKALSEAIYKNVTDDILGLDDWILSCDEEGFLGHSAGLIEESEAIDRSFRSSARIRRIVMELVFCLCTVAILVWASLNFGQGAPQDGSDAVMSLRNLAMLGDISYAPNWIAAFVICFFPLTEAFSTASDDALNYVEHKRAIAETRRISSAKARYSRPSSDGDAGSSNAGYGLAIDIEDVSFSYGSDPKPVLCGLTLKVKAAEHIAILGKSGAGKSSIVKLISQEIAPDSGKVCVLKAPDDVSGGGFADSGGKRDAVNCVSLIEQSPYIFDTTIKENLLIGKPDASDDELLDALDMVGLKDLVLSLDRGLDTQTLEAGKRFSGGETTRIALARALLYDAPILLLDEPFVGVDASRESEILKTILDVFSDKTIVMITHHLLGIEQFDRLVFLSDGAIAIDGDPCALLERDERIKRLMQFDR